MVNTKQVLIKSYVCYLKEKVLEYMKQMLTHITYTCW